ncbi:MAG: gamma-glutamylcyclotransferase [Gemmataceae bacterium]|nr:gamma-glutamylcyclotransferase [Gemmataceae bacterium]MCS7269977.1 gamma-glutamylcyclotransferase [Gemmataceae bacterium]MDW8244598.1 gamma-glutamylcyclotransferase family protein [Thermogemmata sp.]
MPLLFVYGSLRRGQENHALLADQRFVADAVTQRRYCLARCGDYLALVPVQDEQLAIAVPGEVWDVTPARLATLDAFEEVPDVYVRQPVLLEGNWPAEVHAYFQATDQSMT